MKPIEFIENNLPNVEWKETGKEYDGWPSPELFVDGKPTGVTRRGIHEMWYDIHCMCDPWYMKSLLDMKPADLDPKKELLAIIKEQMRMAEEQKEKRKEQNGTQTNNQT